MEQRDLEHSHIIPRFAFKKLKTGGKYHAISSVRGIYDDQTDHKEYLFCSDCEDIFEKHETYVAGKFSKLEINFNSGGERVLDFNYTHLKLFQISILFRCSVSTLNFFKIISLNDSLLDRMREMLLTNDPGEFTEIPCVVAAIHMDRELQAQILTQPSFMHHPLSTDIYYDMDFSGFKWIFCFSKNNDAYIKFISAREENEFSFLTLHLSKLKHLINLFIQANKIGTR